jgi:hypothetical protein
MFEDEFNFSHDALSEKERQKQAEYQQQREAKAMARHAEPDEDEEIDGALERGDMGAQEEEEVDGKKRAAAQAASIVATEGQKAGGLGSGALLDHCDAPFVGPADAYRLNSPHTPHTATHTHIHTPGTYRAYLDGMGGPLVGVGVLLLIMAGQASSIFSNLFLSRWVRLPFEEEQNPRQIYIYVGLVATVAVLSVRTALCRDVPVVSSGRGRGPGLRWG